MPKGALHLNVGCMGRDHSQLLSAPGTRWGKGLTTDLDAGQSGHGGDPGWRGGP